MRTLIGLAVVVAVAAVGVAAADAVPQSANARDFSGTVGEHGTWVVADFEARDSDPAAFAATIDWGDGSRPSGGTIQAHGDPDGDALTNFTVTGSHTYVTAGAFRFAVRISDLGGEVRVEGTATIAGKPGPAPGRDPAPLPGATAAIAGPDVVRFGDPVRVMAAVSPTAVRHEWDLDGDGSYERDMGSDPAVDHNFPHGGNFSIGLRATLADGTRAAATHDVLVERPPLLALETRPTRPKPGQKIRFKLRFEREGSMRFNLIGWRIRGVKPRTESLRIGSNDAPAVVRLRGAEPTRGTTLTKKIEKPGIHLIEITVQDSKGGTQKLFSSVHVGAGKAPAKPFGGDIVDCNKEKGPQDRCADISVLGVPAVGVTTTFQNSTPGIGFCKTKGSPIPANIYDLDYPSPVNFGQGPVAPSGFKTAAGVGAARASGFVDEKKCFGLASKVLEWDLGDGTKIATPDGSGSFLAPHVYQQPGTYKVSLLARVPYEVEEGKGEVVYGPDGESASFFLARKTITIDVADRHCGPVAVQGVPAKPVPREKPAPLGGAPEPQPLQEGTAGCFLKAPGPSGPLYTTFPGYALELGGLPIDNIDFVPNADGVQLVVDPKAATIRSQPLVTEKSLGGGVKIPQAHLVRARWPEQAGVSATEASQPVPVLQIPKPAFDPEIGATVAPLPLKAAKPPATAVAKVTGLAAPSVQALVSPAGGPFLRAWVKVPPPLGGGTPPVIVKHGPQATSASHLADTDFTMVLSGLDLGFFELKEFTLEHLKAGGWIGGGIIAIRFLPNPRELIAPYKPLSDSEQCEEVSSGLALGSGGEFQFAGAAGIFSPPLPLGGAAALSCIAVKGQTNPFVMEGRVKANVPPPGPFSFDGCFLMTVLKAGQTTTVLDGEGQQVPGPPGCGLGQPYTAESDLAWFYTNATLGVFGLNLADGYLDIKATSGGVTGKAKGSTGRDFGVVSFSASVEGGIVLPQFAFHLIGSAEVCEEVTKWVPGIGGLIEELGLDCFDGEAGIGTKGARFCASSLGVKISAGGDVSFGACDVDELKVASAFATSTTLDGPLVLGTQARERRVAVPRGLRQAVFRIQGDGGPPAVTLTGPRGVRIVDDLGAVQSGRAYRLIHFARGETVVEVDRPAAGVWRIEARPDGPAISRVALSRPLPEPRVTARVLGRGRQRTLAYRARLSRSERVRFIEDGKVLTRALGSVDRSGRGRIRIRPTTSPGGMRAITAVVERGRVPYRRFSVATYRAPGPPRVRPPRALRARVLGNRLRLRWRAAPGAKRYEAVVRLASGRAARVQARRPRVKVPDVEPQARGRIAVVAIAADGRRSAPTRVRLLPRRAKPVVVRFG